ncbi:MAG: hypothetical protein IH921_14920 [Gemmatimonadetes bacterium]|nr:hypothetical protein [Gemmatimonadota bacterium]
MARYNDAVCRLCRREGTKLFLKGDRCFSAKCGIERRAYPPGQHGQGRARLFAIPAGAGFPSSAVRTRSPGRTTVSRRCRT